jgi:hypothetical protein
VQCVPCTYTSAVQVETLVANDVEFVSMGRLGHSVAVAIEAVQRAKQQLASRKMPLLPDVVHAAREVRIFCLCVCITVL